MFKRTIVTTIALSLLGSTCASAAVIPASQQASSVSKEEQFESYLPREEAPEVQATLDPSWFNLRDWISLQNRSDERAPEGTLARVVTCLLTRDTGALVRPSDANLPAFTLDKYLTENGKKAKSKLEQFDVSSPWLYTLHVEKIEKPKDQHRTYRLKGTSRTSQVGGIYPVEIAISLVKSSNGRWLADDFDVFEVNLPQAIHAKDFFDLALPGDWSVIKDNLPVPVLSFKKAEKNIGGLQPLNFPQGNTVENLYPNHSQVAEMLNKYPGEDRDLYWVMLKRLPPAAAQSHEVNYERHYYFLDREHHIAYDLYFDADAVDSVTAWQVTNSFRLCPPNKN
ncbi:hypothetical protein H1S01_07795 [Heliobacterium chlorum]|uniref:Uncharacterized protein n=1 Tax=Heliobacterium chlorum TaxID=2698 RepID=A0ABR7T0U9_HELCL|nr:hypothetical protein [Heliobacterium chlorum]MBC9784413.1 hypothetical protein [Heliobacterium chlorum]